MAKIKFIFLIVLGFIIYKGYVAFTEFEIGVEDRVAGIEDKADFEREGEVIGLMMYLGDPPELKEHLYTKNKSKCLEMKQIAEETSFAYYECARVEAILAGMAEAKSKTGNGKPICVLLYTEMGNGIDFMMHTHAWHGKAPNDEQLESALAQNPETLGDY